MAFLEGLVPTFFDGVTLILIILGLISQLTLWLLSQRYSQYLKFGVAFILLTLVCQGVLIYGSLIEPRWLEVNEQNVTLAAGDNRLKIVFIADLHIGPYKKAEFVQEVVELANRQNPDLVLLGGDFIYSYQNQADQLYPLKELQAKYGVYGVLGNHDYGLTQANEEDKIAPGAVQKSFYVSQKLEEFGVKLLRNEITKIEVDNSTITLVGLEDLWGGLDDYSPTLEQVDEDETVILLEHNPDIVLDEASHKADLILSGHTHGGQIRLPIIGAPAGIPSKLEAKYAYGLFDWNENTQLFITKGAGEMGPRARLFCRPEIVVLNVNF